ncbi:MAG: vitamin B12 dependent-methionine synthase activation domain-containing protein [Dehalococcoidales bacterium]|nr:vitamin B12 dependent-methionine synthase activation domain-containing protein [Dehalococcoidales bacterium]
MEQPIVFTDIPVKLNAEEVIKKLHLHNQNVQIEDMVKELVDDVSRIARPKAIYRVAYIENKKDDSVEIGGITFTSHVLRLNLDKVERVFPYVATCGKELDAFKPDDSDVMKSFCLDLMKRLVVLSAVDFLTARMKQRHELGQMSHMNPGSLTDWPITQQKQLFALFEDIEGQIGVLLSESCVMRPLKSVSGIYFPTEARFESCQLCPREKCIGRRAPYSPEIAETYSHK